MPDPKVEVFEGESDDKIAWYFHVVGGNGEIVCQSESYSSKQHAEDGLNALTAIVLQVVAKEAASKLT